MTEKTRHEELKEMTGRVSSGRKPVFHRLEKLEKHQKLCDLALDDQSEALVALADAVDRLDKALYSILLELQKIKTPNRKPRNSFNNTTTPPVK